MERHTIVAKIIHKEILKNLNIQENTLPYYKYTPDTIVENDTYKIYWDRTIYSDKTLTCNRQVLQ